MKAVSVTNKDGLFYIQSDNDTYFIYYISQQFEHLNFKERGAMRLRLSVCILVIFFLGFSGVIHATRLRPAKVTHYFYTPTAYLNDEFGLVVSLHEISWALPQHLQIHLSLLDNVGRICLGMRYGIAENLSVGLGLANTLIKGHSAGHAIHDARGRLGLFLTYGIIQDPRFEFAITPHIQIGDRISIGPDFGLMFTPSEYWSFMSEMGISLDLTDEIEPWFNLIGGARFHIPKWPNFHFDLGIDLAETRMQDYTPDAKAFIDIIFTMNTK